MAKVLNQLEKGLFCTVLFATPLKRAHTRRASCVLCSLQQYCEAFFFMLYPFSYAAHNVSLTRRGQRADTQLCLPWLCLISSPGLNCNWLHALPLRKLPNNARIRQIWRRLWTSTFVGCRLPPPAPYYDLLCSLSPAGWSEINEIPKSMLCFFHTMFFSGLPQFICHKCWLKLGTHF